MVFAEPILGIARFRRWTRHAVTNGHATRRIDALLAIGAFHIGIAEFIAHARRRIAGIGARAHHAYASRRRAIAGCGIADRPWKRVASGIAREAAARENAFALLTGLSHRALKVRTSIDAGPLNADQVSWTHNRVTRGYAHPVHTCAARRTSAPGTIRRYTQLGARHRGSAGRPNRAKCIFIVAIDEALAVVAGEVSRAAAGLAVAIAIRGIARFRSAWMGIRVRVVAIAFHGGTHA